MALPPDRKVTTGEAIGSEAVNVRVTTLFETASVVVALFEAMLTELSVGATMLETVTALPERSAIVKESSAPTAQSSAAARLYVVPSIEVLPFLFRSSLKLPLSVAERVIVNSVEDEISTLSVSVSA